MAVNIHSTVTGSGPDVILIHGLFGMGSNLGALARDLQQDFTVHSIDLPNHGRSGWVESADIPLMADAVMQWMDDKQLLSAALLGHSLGGKVAMQITQQTPDRAWGLLVADIAPVAYPAAHTAEFDALRAVSVARCRSRAEAAEIMSRYLEQDTVVQFLLKSLTRGTEGEYQWRFNLIELIAGYEAIRAAVSPGSSFGQPVLFIKGGESNYIQQGHRDQILSMFPQAEVKIMSGCGHWLHAEQPRLFNSIVKRFLGRCAVAKTGKDT
jgi:esterase